MDRGKIKDLVSSISNLWEEMAYLNFSIQQKDSILDRLYDQPYSTYSSAIENLETERGILEQKLASEKIEFQKAINLVIGEEKKCSRSTSIFEDLLLGNYENQHLTCLSTSHFLVSRDKENIKEEYHVYFDQYLYTFVHPILNNLADKLYSEDVICVYSLEKEKLYEIKIRNNEESPSVTAIFLNCKKGETGEYRGPSFSSLNFISFPFEQDFSILEMQTVFGKIFREISENGFSFEQEEEKFSRDYLIDRSSAEFQDLSSVEDVPLSLLNSIDEIKYQLEISMDIYLSEQNKIKTETKNLEKIFSEIELYQAYLQVLEYQPYLFHDKQFMPFLKQFSKKVKFKVPLLLCGNVPIFYFPNDSDHLTYAFFSDNKNIYHFFQKNSCDYEDRAVSIMMEKISLEEEDTKTTAIVNLAPKKTFEIEIIDVEFNKKSSKTISPNQNNLNKSISLENLLQIFLQLPREFLIFKNLLVDPVSLELINSELKLEVWNDPLRAFEQSKYNLSEEAKLYLERFQTDIENGLVETNSFNPRHKQIFSEIKQIIPKSLFKYANFSNYFGCYKNQTIVNRYHISNMRVESDRTRTSVSFIGSDSLKKKFKKTVFISYPENKSKNCSLRLIKLNQEFDFSTDLQLKRMGISLRYYDSFTGGKEISTNFQIISNRIEFSGEESKNPDASDMKTLYFSKQMPRETLNDLKGIPFDILFGGENTFLGQIFEEFYIPPYNYDLVKRIECSSASLVKKKKK